MKKFEFFASSLLAGFLTLSAVNAAAAEQTPAQRKGFAQQEQVQGQRMGQDRRGVEQKSNQREGRSSRGNMPAFADFDLNADGKIIPEEFTEARTARISQRAKEGRQMRGLAEAFSFEEIDSNGDGIITPEEFAAARALHQQQKRQSQGRDGMRQGTRQDR